MNLPKVTHLGNGGGKNGSQACLPPVSTFITSVTTAERMRWRTHSKMLVLQDETRNSPFCLAILIVFFFKNYLINVKDLRVCHFYGLFVTD